MVDLLGVGAHGVLDHRAGGAVVLGELFDQIGDVLGHPHPSWMVGSRRGRPRPRLGATVVGSATGAACTGGDETTGAAGWGVAVGRGV